MGYYHETPEDLLFDPTMYEILRAPRRVRRLGRLLGRQRRHRTADVPGGVHALGRRQGRRRRRPPACVPIVSVGALNPNGTDALFSNAGPWVRAYAPGAAVMSTLPPFQGGLEPQARTEAYMRDARVDRPRRLQRLVRAVERHLVRGATVRRPGRRRAGRRASTPDDDDRAARPSSGPGRRWPRLTDLSAMMRSCRGPTNCTTAPSAAVNSGAFARAIATARPRPRGHRRPRPDRAHRPHPSPTSRPRPGDAAAGIERCTGLLDREDLDRRDARAGLGRSSACCCMRTGDADARDRCVPRGRWTCCPRPARATGLRVPQPRQRAPAAGRRAARRWPTSPRRATSSPGPGTTLQRAKAEHNLGYARLLTGDLVGAIQMIDEAAPVLSPLSAPYRATVEQDRAEILTAAGRPREAIRALEHGCGGVRVPPAAHLPGRVRAHPGLDAAA